MGRAGESDGFERMRVRKNGKCGFERAKIGKRWVLTKKIIFF